MSRILNIDPQQAWQKIKIELNLESTVEYGKMEIWKQLRLYFKNLSSKIDPIQCSLKPSITHRSLLQTQDISTVLWDGQINLLMHNETYDDWQSLLAIFDTVLGFVFSYIDFIVADVFGSSQTNQFSSNEFLYQMHFQQISILACGNNL